MTIRRPTARVTLDGRALTASEAALGGVRLELGLGGAHDRALVAMSSQSPFADVDVGAVLEVALGYGDDIENVFTGTAVAVDWCSAGLTVEGVAKTNALSLARVAQSYLQQSVADIVRDLVDLGAADAGQIDATLTLHAYHVDERRTVWAHLQDLARVASCDLYGDAAGALCFRPPRSGPADHTLRYGAELLAWSFGRRDQGAQPPAVVAHGAASESGAEAWHLIVREPDGSPPSEPTLVHPALRDRDGADAFARGLADARSRRAIGGHLVAVGDATLRPGAVIDLADLPEGSPGALRAVAVVHALDARCGFVSRVRVEAAA